MTAQIDRLEPDAQPTNGRKWSWGLTSGVGSVTTTGSVVAVSFSCQRRVKLGRRCRSRLVGALAGADLACRLLNRRRRGGSDQLVGGEIGRLVGHSVVL